MAESKETGPTIEYLIQSIKSGASALDQFIGKSMEEMYQSGDFGVAAIKGTKDPGELQRFRALRILAIRGSNLISAIITSEEPETNNQEIIDIFKNETDLLHPEIMRYGIASEFAIKALEASGLITVAAMGLNESVRTGNRIVTVAYPKVYMELVGGDSPLAREAAFGIAGYFLKSTPFGNNQINLPIPSN